MVSFDESINEFSIPFLFQTGAFVESENNTIPV